MQSVTDFLAEQGLPESRRDFVQGWLDKGGIPPKILRKLKRETIMTPKGRPIGSRNELKARRAALMKIATNTEHKDMLDAQQALITLDEQQLQRNKANSVVSDLTAARAEIARLSGEVARLTAELAESETAGNEAIDTLERERTERATQ